MRNIFYSLLAIAVIGSSCQKKVIDVTPQNLLPYDQAFTTPDRMEKAVLAGYDALQSPEFLSGRLLVYVDVMGEDIFDLNGYFGDLPRFNMLSSNGYAANVWNAGYYAIASANRAADGIAATNNVVSANKAKQLIAECKFIRAVSNFYLVNFYGQPYGFTPDASHPGIPLVMQSFSKKDTAANIPRSSVGAVYAAIIKDLTDALADIPVTYGDSYDDVTRGTKASVSAFLSRVYLYKGDFANAKKYAADVIAGTYGTFKLQADPAAPFAIGNYQTSESIWSIPNNANDNPNTNNALPQHYSPFGRGDLAISNTYLDIATNPYFALDDKRRDMIISGDPASGTQDYFFTSKYTDITNRADWAPVIRYPEVLLTYAEAQARLAASVDQDAIDKLNIVRDRSKATTTPSYTIADFATKDALIAAILGERRIELAFEGHRFWDLMRTKTTVTNKYDSDGSTLLKPQPFGDPKDVFPIPQVEVDKSKGTLRQNLNY